MNYNPSNPFGIFIDWKQALGLSRCGVCLNRKECNELDLYGKCKKFKDSVKPELVYHKSCLVCSNYFDCIEKDNDRPNCHNFKKYIPRCDKCVYPKSLCGAQDFHGECSTFKYDPPDGGYYG